MKTTNNDRVEAGEGPWHECEMCGYGVSPQAAVYGMPIHGECWAQLTPKGREKIAHSHGVTYDSKTETTPER